MNQTVDEQIITIAEISLNAWCSLQQNLDDGWILRFADGYTKRVNSVNPIYPCNKNVRKSYQYFYRIKEH